MSNVKEYLFYNNRFGRYDPIEEERLKKCLNLIKEKKPKKVLDVGCGDGFFANRIKQHIQDVEVYGIDVSQKAVDLAKQKGVIAKRANVDKDIPFDNDFFDAVYMGEVIEHLFDPDNALKEINRVSKKSGVVILSTPNLACWYNRILLLLGFQPAFTDVSSIDNTLGRKLISSTLKTPGVKGGHIHIFTYRAIKDMLELYNFQPEKIESTPYVQLFTSNRFIFILDRIFSSVPPLASDIIIRARKIADVNVTQQ